MTDLQDDQSRTNLTVTQLSPANTGSHDGDEALALTLIEFDAPRRPSGTGWRHFLRLQELASAPVELLGHLAQLKGAP